MSATFLINDVFSIAGRGTIVTGAVKEGEISVGMGGHIGGLEIKIIAIEIFQKTLATAKEGDNCGLLLGGIKKEDVKNGEIIIFE